MDAAMMIQLVLSALLLPLALFVALQRATSRLLRLIALAMMATGLYLVWQPEQANWLARGLGVGRGADVILYLWTVITVSVIFMLYLKIAQMNRVLTELARRIALDRPMFPCDQTIGEDDQSSFGGSAALQAGSSERSRSE
jgi:small membrane protein